MTYMNTLLSPMPNATCPAVACATHARLLHGNHEKAAVWLFGCLLVLDSYRNVSGYIFGGCTQVFHTAFAKMRDASDLRKANCLSTAKMI
jgi:hypothetical protein